MGITKKIKFVNQERLETTTTSSSTYVHQGTMLNSGELTGGNNYLFVMWANCTSPGDDEGNTKFAWEGGGGDILGSEYQRHDTTNSGMQICHITQQVAPDPPQNIGIYRKKRWSAGGGDESTGFGQCFAIDLSYSSGTDGALTSGIDWSSSVDNTTRTPTPSTYLHTHTVNNTSGTHLVLAIAKATDASDSSDTLIGLYKNYTAAPVGAANIIQVSGSKYTQDTQDVKSIVFGIATDLNSGSQIKLKSLDTNNLTVDYSYVFTLNIDDAPQTKATGQLTTWTDSTASGSWGTTVVNGNDDDSFVIAMGRQTETGIGSGRMASISLKNNTRGEWLLFNDRTGDYNPIYFPSTNPGANIGQFETSLIVGVGAIGSADEIEMRTL